MRIGIDIRNKVTKPDFRKKILGVRKGEKPPFLGVYSYFLKNASMDFPDFLHDVRNRYYKQSDEARFSKKNFWGVRRGEKPLFLGVYSDFIENYSNDFVETLHDVSRLVGATFDNSRIFRKILNPGLIRCEKSKIGRFLGNQPPILTILLLNDKKSVTRIFRDFLNFCWL